MMKFLSKPEPKPKRADKAKNRPVFAQWRFYVVLGMLLLALTALLIQLARMQVVDPDRLIAEGNKRSIRHQEVIVPRGMIMDRNGRALAVSVPMRNIWADPKIVRQKGGVDVNSPRWQALAESVNLSVHDLANKLNNSKGRFVYLARQVTPAQADYIKQLKLAGISSEKTSKRFYPVGESLAQLIGFTDIDGKGVEGIERSFNDWLTGESGQRIVRRDRFGRVIEDLGTIAPEDAKNLTLSIDERLQALAFKELSQAVAFNKADSGTAVLLDIQTGEILAMATSPSFNPNNRSQFAASRLRNRAVTDAFEPGSTVKPLVVMAALENGVANTEEMIDTRPFYLNKYEVKDVSYHRELNLQGILDNSSNVGVSRLALRMQPKTLVNFYARFGLGQPTHLGLGGETRGTIGADRQRFADIERATFAFGYGLMVTPLQLARAYATIGSYGIYRPVSIQRIDEPVKGRRVVDEKVAKKVVELMETVATVGGGRRASVPGYHVAVKTGTAKKVGANGRYVNKYLAYTAGIAPVSHPRYSLVVMIDNPKAGQYYGGTVSAPVFSRIMGGVLRTMNIEPDYPVNDPLEAH